MTSTARGGLLFWRAQLLDNLYSDHRVVTDRTVDSHVKNLRRNLERASPEREVVESVYGGRLRLELLG